MHPYLFYCVVCFTSLALFGCDQPSYQDPDIKKSREDFAALAKPVRKCPSRITYKGTCGTEPPCYKTHVSLCLSGQLPLQEVFFELAKQASVNIVFDKPCSKPVTVLYHAQDKPLGKVLDDLSSAYNLRHYYQNDTLHITPDTPHLRTHNIQFLIGARKTQTETAVKTDILGHGSKKNIMAQENGASIQIKSHNEVNFWEELEKNLRYILGENQHRDKQTYALNRYAGMLSVWGTAKQHRAIERYLKHLQRLSTTQVLIEAKIIEIELTDEHRSGIQWDSLPAFTTSVNAKASLSDGAFFSFFLDTKNLNAFANFMNKFGTVRTLANPRLTVLNNQPSVLKVARNEVFFEMQVDDVMMTGNNAPYIQKARSQIQTVPIGLILYVHPVVNFETGQIILFLHPTISRIIDVKNDPSVALSMKGMPTQIKSEIPVVQVREMDSVVAAKENQVIVIGGLMEESADRKTSGIPGLSDIPLLGRLFQYEENVKRLTELVILLRPKIIYAESTMDLADQRLSQEFSQDPRPFTP